MTELAQALLAAGIVGTFSAAAGLISIKIAEHIVEEADKMEEKEMSEDLLKVLAEQGIMTNFIPQYLNQAIVFTDEDMGSDRIMFSGFLYIVIAIIAFIFAVTTSNTIAKEATVIGTLRASGYTRGEIIRHYMTLPVLVTFASAVVGNILGYTVFLQVALNIYY